MPLTDTAQPLAYGERDLDRENILSRKTRWRLRRLGRFPEPRKVGGRKLYVGEEIRAWLHDPESWATCREEESGSG